MEKNKLHDELDNSFASNDPQQQQQQQQQYQNSNGEYELYF